MSGNLTGALQQLYLIWSHQIQAGREKLVYGRGSPEMRFLSEEANEDKQTEFAGALPTTIYQAGFSEVYGQSPDIDSTALMVSTTAWILARLKKRGLLPSSSSSPSVAGGGDQGEPSTTASEQSSDYVSALLLRLGITDPARAADYLVPRMLKAVDYLARRDVDGDGLLEQGHNEDWMDTVLRAGKIVYSQACWILALKNLSALLSVIGKDNDARRMAGMADTAIRSVEQRLWSEQDGAYIDIQEAHHIGGPYRTLTQDVSLYLVAISEYADADASSNDNNRRQDSAGGERTASHPLDDGSMAARANSTLGAIKNRMWMEKWPLVTEVELSHTGPWALKPHQYHNLTFWPWTTGIEMLARSRFGMAKDCDTLLSTLSSEGKLNMHAFYEWVNPVTGGGNGAFPFRTGVSAVRIAIVDIFNGIRRKREAMTEKRLSPAET
jgi:hypothetical protein